MKRVLVSFILICSICAECVISVSAKAFDDFTKEEVASEKDFWDIYRGTTARNFSTDNSVAYAEHNICQAIESDSAFEVEDILLEMSHIDLEETGRVCFIDPIAAYTDGSYQNITNIANWYTSDENVVSIYNGQLIANQSGNAIVTLTYQDITKNISVSVLNTVNPAEIIETLSYNDSATTFNSSTTDRNTIISTAKSMVEMTWTPTQNLTGWKGSIFSQGKTVTGMPYSQTPYQKDKNGFLSSMSNGDFYSVYIDAKQRSMPRYGNDCSGFLSFSWGISRTTTQGFLKGISDGTYSTVGGTDIVYEKTVLVNIEYIIMMMSQ